MRLSKQNSSSRQGVSRSQASNQRMDRTDYGKRRSVDAALAHSHGGRGGGEGVFAGRRTRVTLWFWDSQVHIFCGLAELVLPGKLYCWYLGLVGTRSSDRVMIGAALT